jgi:hypothetical protein
MKTLYNQLKKNALLVLGLIFISTSVFAANSKTHDSCYHKHEKISLYDNQDGKEIKYDVRFCEGKIIEILKDGNKVSEEDFGKYKKLVRKKLTQLNMAHFPPIPPMPLKFHVETDNIADDEIEIGLPGEFLWLSSDSLCKGIKEFDIKIDMEDFKEHMKDLKHKINVFKFRHDDDFEIDCEDDIDNCDSVKEYKKIIIRLDTDKDMDSVKKEIKKIKVMVGDKKEIVQKSQSFISELKKELVRDGVLENEKEFTSMEFSKDEMVINGNKLSENLFLKYKQLHKEKTGKDIDGKMKIKINEDKD